MRRFAVVNQKGGVGKTSIAANLAAAWGRGGKRVLAIDTDPQANLTMAFGLQADEAQLGVLHLIGDESQTNLSALAMTTSVSNVDLVAGTQRMRDLEQKLIGETMRETVLRRRLEVLLADAPYDVVIFDTPPHLGQITVNVLFAVDELLIPVNMGDEFGASGLMETVKTIDRLHELGESVQLRAIVRSHVDGRSVRGAQSSYHEIMRVLDHLGQPIAETEIPVDQNVSNMIAKGVPVTAQRPALDVSSAYRHLARELLEPMPEAIGEAA